MLTDTVGFIRKLPHQLVQAFRATLEEMRYADILIHVVDASNPEREQQMETVYNTLKELGCGETPVITAFNKMDREVEFPLPADDTARDSIRISASNGDGLTELLTSVEDLIKSFKKNIKVLIPYSEGKLSAMIYSRCELLSEEHTGEGLLAEIYADEEMTNRLRPYIVNED